MNPRQEVADGGPILAEGDPGGKPKKIANILKYNKNCSMTKLDGGTLFAYVRARFECFAGCPRVASRQPNDC
jgi:hypothetical protein